MTNYRTAVNAVLMLFLAGMTVGCACKSAVKGGHAFAQKVEMEDDGPMIRPPMTETPITEHPAFAKYGLCQRVHFDYDKSDIKEEWKECLDKLAAAMIEETEFLLIVEGHCDERGSDSYNIALGDRRAVATKAYLVGKGLNANRIQTRSMGESMPLATCSNESCWWQNRRSEFYVVQTAR